MNFRLNFLINSPYIKMIVEELKRSRKERLHDDYSIQNQRRTPGLNISTGCWTVTGKKSSYVRRKLIHNRQSCPA